MSRLIPLFQRVGGWWGNIMFRTTRTSPHTTVWAGVILLAMVVAAVVMYDSAFRDLRIRCRALRSGSANSLGNRIKSRKGGEMYDSQMAGDFYIQTDAECSEPTTGELLAGYILGDLPPADVERIGRHLEHCEYCRLGLQNWQTFTNAMKRARAEREEDNVLAFTQEAGAF